MGILSAIGNMAQSTAFQGGLVGLGQAAPAIGQGVGSAISAAQYDPVRRRIGEALGLLNDPNLDEARRSQIIQSLQADQGLLATSPRDEDQRTAEFIPTIIANQNSLLETKRQHTATLAESKAARDAQAAEQAANRSQDIARDASQRTQRNQELVAQGAMREQTPSILDAQGGQVTGEAAQRFVPQRYAVDPATGQRTPTTDATGMPLGQADVVAEDTNRRLTREQQAEEARNQEQYRRDSLAAQRDPAQGMAARLGLAKSTLGTDPDTGEMRPIPAHFISWIESGDERLKPAELGGTVRGSAQRQSSGVDAAYSQIRTALAGIPLSERGSALNNIELDTDPVRRAAQYQAIQKYMTELDRDVTQSRSVEALPVSEQVSRLLREQAEADRTSSVPIAAQRIIDLGKTSDPRVLEELRKEAARMRPWERNVYQRTYNTAEDWLNYGQSATSRR